MTTASATPAVRTEPEGFKRPPGLLFLAATVIAAGIALEANSRDSPMGLFFAFVAWLVIFTAWLVRLVFLATPQSRTVSCWKVRWALPMVILLGATLLMATGLPTRVRFEASRPALDDLVTQVLTRGATNVQSVGFYDIDRLERTTFGVRFLVEGSGFLDGSGYAFSTDGGTPDSGSDDVYHPMGGGWYRWIRVF